MKESWIRKLKNILNEYEDYKEEKFWKRDYKWICYWKENPRISADRTEWEWVNNCLYEDESRAVIISKGYNFIKRLVVHNKIETKHLSLQAFKNIFSGGWFVKVSDLEVLLMLLSIQDNPIEFLISILR